MSDTVRYSYMTTPVGRLLLVRGADGLRRIFFESGKGKGQPEGDWERDDGAFGDVRGQLEEYFSGARTDFDLPLSPQGTAFQLAAWRALRGIPYGETRSYGEQAKAIGRPRAVRAVGAANGANPLPIVVPCHRVIGSDGSLTGFGGGLDVKEKLLAHERKHMKNGQLALT